MKLMFGEGVDFDTLYAAFEMFCGWSVEVTLCNGDVMEVELFALGKEMWFGFEFRRLDDDYLPVGEPFWVAYDDVELMLVH